MNEKFSWLEKLSSGEASYDEVKKNVLQEKDDNEKSSLHKFIHIKVESSDGDKVNLKVPLGLGKLLLRKGTLIKGTPIKESDIDPEEILAMLEQGEYGELVDIESSDGDRVKIFVK